MEQVMERVESPETTRAAVAAWPDAWLLDAARRDVPDTVALEVLAQRHWRTLFGRCRLLTNDVSAANDLAQEVWCRVLRARGSLKPDGNFPAYLVTIAINISRDQHRSARRAGEMAEHRLASLDAGSDRDGPDGGVLADILPDLNSLSAEEQTLLKLDIDDALGQLEPLLRDVLVARFLNDESAADIGRRYGRTEQTVTAWVRQGVRQMKSALGASYLRAPREDSP